MESAPTPETRVEFAVQMSCDSCVDAISKVLTGKNGIRHFEVNKEIQQVVVDSSLPIGELQALLELSGKKAIVKGLGKPSAAAVAIIGGKLGAGFDVKGVIRFLQEDQGCIIDGTLDGLSPGFHGLHVHQSGDLSQGCESVGDHFNPYGSPHGAPTDPMHLRHVGDLGNVKANEEGRVAFRFVDPVLRLSDVIGRAVVVTSRPDDFGRGGLEASKINGNSGDRLACGIIARSAGLFQNPKKICLCSGATVWEERNFVEENPRSSESRP